MCLALTADALGFDEEASAAYARWNQLERGGPGGARRDPPGAPAPR